MTLFYTARNIQPNDNCVLFQLQILAISASLDSMKSKHLEAPVFQLRERQRQAKWLKVCIQFSFQRNREEYGLNKLRLH